MDVVVVVVEATTNLVVVVVVVVVVVQAYNYNQIVLVVVVGEREMGDNGISYSTVVVIIFSTHPVVKGQTQKVFH